MIFCKKRIGLEVWAENLQAKGRLEKTEILENLSGYNISISNLHYNLETLLSFSTQLTTVWSSANYTTKEKLQKIIFPEGFTIIVIIVHFEPRE